MLFEKWTTLKAQSDNRNWLSVVSETFCSRVEEFGEFKVEFNGGERRLYLYDTWPLALVAGTGEVGLGDTIYDIIIIMQKLKSKTTRIRMLFIVHTLKVTAA